MTELKRKLLLYELAKVGYRDAEYISDSNLIRVKRGNDRIADIYDNGDLRYGIAYDKLVFNTISPIADRVQEVAAAWEKSNAMPFEGVTNFRLLSEYNSIIFAARDDTKKGYGLHYVTWECNSRHTAVEHGHYTTDYANAKQDFAVRAGLIDSAKVFTPEQAAEIKAAVEYRIENDGDITYEAEEILMEIAGKLDGAYPAKEVPVQRDEAEKSRPIKEKQSILARLEEKPKEVHAAPQKKKDNIEI